MKTDDPGIVRSGSIAAGTTNRSTMMKRLLLLLAGCGLLALWAAQNHSLKTVREELAGIRQELDGWRSQSGRPVRTPSPATSVSREPARASTTDAFLEQRLASLEQTVSDLEQESRYLMDRGQLPPNADYLAEMRNKFFDPSITDRDRMQALRLLRRGNALDDAVLQYTANWLQAIPEDRMREELLRNLEGLTNGILRDPFIQLAAQSGDARVREQAVDNLRRYLGDPQVEALMWDRYRNDPERRVRDEAASALRGGPYTETRIAALRQYAVNAQAPLEERLLAASALRSARTEAPEVIAAMAQLAQSLNDTGQRLRVFQTFNGTSDPTFIPAFVAGLQDANPAIRRQAANSLSGLRSHQTVAEWLRYIAESDPDPNVRRDAASALGSRGR
jgi:HEAT repeat protein